MATIIDRPSRLDRLLADRTDLRSPETVLAPATLGAARLSRYSFNRSMLRRAARDGWTARLSAQELDDQGRGHSVYEIDTGDHLFSFVAVTTTLDESAHTDRVIAERWEIAALLVEGRVAGARLAELCAAAPAQESARLDASVLVLTRGNRSVRFFEYLVDRLASGRQPEAAAVSDAGYIMRSTAFYANGKYGMRSFDGYEDDHPFQVPYRAQFVASWCFRELSYDVVEHCARARGGTTSVGFDDEWRQFFGLGNATGLGLVPYAFNHPDVLHTWCAVRELALAEVRALPSTPARRALLELWLDRAAAHVANGTDRNCEPFLSPAQLAPVIRQLRDAWDAASPGGLPFDDFYRRAEGLGVEAQEFAVSLLIELHEGDDDLFDQLLVADESRSIDSTMPAAELGRLIDDHYRWIDDLDLDHPDADTFWWVISDNTEEPRRVRRDRLDPAGRDVAIDIALRVGRLRDAVAASPAEWTVGELLAEWPLHRGAVERVQNHRGIYSEPHDNACAASYLPLQLQRFQLAMYGMDDFTPKSTDWLRVTLNQGAPRFSDLGPDMGDTWALPVLPDADIATTGRARA